jgi:hypothetical protein
MDDILQKYGLTPPPPVEPDATGLAAPMNAAPIPDAPVNPAHMPGDIDTPAVPPHVSFLDRLLSVPSALEGQFTKKDLDSMRGRALMKMGAYMANSGNAGFLPALLGGASTMQDEFQNSLNAGVKQSIAGNEMGNTQNLRKADALIAAKYPAPADETPKAKLIRLTQMGADYAAMGQPDRAKALAEVVKNLKASLGGVQEGEKFQSKRLLNGDMRIFSNVRGYLKKGGNPENPNDWEPETHDTGVDLQNSYKERRMNQADQQRWMAMNHFERKMYDDMDKDFTKDPQVEPALKMHANYLHLESTLKQALDNPAAASQLAGQIAQFADSKGRLQIGFLNYINNIDKSYGGQLQRALQLAMTGTLPAGQVKNVKRLMDAIEAGSEQEVRSARARFIKSKAGVVDTDLLNKRLPTVEDLFSGAAPAKAVQLDEAVPDEE